MFEMYRSKSVSTRCRQTSELVVAKNERTTQRGSATQSAIPKVAVNRPFGRNTLKKHKQTLVATAN